MLNDHEQKTLREVECQFLAEDPQFTRAFEARQARLSRHPHRLGASLAVVVAALLTAFLLVAGSPGSALVVATTTGLIIWAVWHRSTSTNRPTP